MTIQLADLTLRFGPVEALNGVSLRVARGEKVAIIGPSGAGKTSLLRVLCAAQRPSTGRVELLGENPWLLPRGALRHLRGRIALMHQFPPLPPRQRVVTALLAAKLPRWPAWKSAASLIYPRDVDAAHAALQRLELEEKLFERCDRLSGGQRQRVGLARLFLGAGELFLVDEPISSLDPQLSERAIGELQQETQQRGATLIASLHAIDVALRWFPRIIGLKAGRVAFDQPVEQVTQQQLEDLYASEHAQPAPVFDDTVAPLQLKRSACY